MNVLALDTSSEGCSAALLSDGRVIDRFTLAPRGHTRLLMPMVRELLAERGLSVTELNAVAFACGPGSFTGLRIATGVVQGLAYGLDIPVIPVSSLAVVAAQVIGHGAITEGAGVAVAFDARMGEVYWGCYLSVDGLPVLTAEERVCPPGQVSLPGDPEHWTGAGSGWALVAQMPASVVQRAVNVDATLIPRAREVALLAVRDWEQGHHVTAAEARPVYLRDEVTWKKLPGR